MIGYRRAAVASTFSPTFAAVLAEARCFARHAGTPLEVLHAAAWTAEKEGRFREAMEDPVSIRWLEAESPSAALLGVAADYDLLIAGALQREDGERPFTSSVARDLLRNAPCDLLLVPRPAEAPAPPAHVVFVLDPGEGKSGALRRAVDGLRPRLATIVVAQTPFAAAIAASRGEAPVDIDEWLEELSTDLEGLETEFDSRLVTSNTGYGLCEAIEGLAADLLVIRAAAGGPLPSHVDWLQQVIPTRLLVLRSA